jgi:hypothetical protein
MITRARLARQNSEESCENGGAVESLGKSKPRLSTAPWESPQNRRFPHSHSSGGGCFYWNDRGLKTIKTETVYTKIFTQPENLLDSRQWLLRITLFLISMR